FRMPAEWEPHAATWLAWPHEHTDWPGKFAPIPWVYAEVVRHLVPGERVHILVADAAMETRARRVLTQAPADLRAVGVFPIPTHPSGTRDFCPISVRGDDGEVAITNWRLTAGRSTRTTAATMRCRTASRAGSAAGSGSPCLAVNESSSRAAASR